MYDYANRYRCTIIRGKAQSEIENLIPVYADVILACEGADVENFTYVFDSALSKFLSSPTKKTLDNHRTEIAGKLYGMYFFEGDRLIVSPRTKRVSEDNDLPSFFKSIISYFQFPNGADAVQTVTARINDGIKIRPYHFVLNLLKEAADKNITLAKREIAYYALDSYDVLRGIASPNEVLDIILKDRAQRVVRCVEYFDENGSKKPSSFSMQHISEQLNILELANLIRQYSDAHETLIKLNNTENVFINTLTAQDYSEILFDVYSYEEVTNLLRSDWQEFYCMEHLELVIPQTSTVSLLTSETQTPSGLVSNTPLEIGDEGEKIVFDYEKKRVAEFNSRLAQQRVLLQGKQRGLGYDIQSVWADLAKLNGKDSDGVFFIEVKSTKRLTQPKLDANDKIILTRNEFLAAQQHADSFAIFRVYLTSKGVFVYKIFNPLSPDAQCQPLCTPISYNYEFSMMGGLEKWQ